MSQYEEITRLWMVLGEEGIGYRAYREVDGFKLTIPKIPGFVCCEHAFSIGGSDDLLEISELLTDEERSKGLKSVGGLSHGQVWDRISKRLGIELKAAAEPPRKSAEGSSAWLSDAWLSEVNRSAFASLAHRFGFNENLFGATMTGCISGSEYVIFGITSEAMLEAVDSGGHVHYFSRDELQRMDPPRLRSYSERLER